MAFLPHLERASHELRDVFDPLTAAIEQTATARILGLPTGIPLTSARRNLERARAKINAALDALTLAADGAEIETPDFELTPAGYEAIFDAKKGAPPKRGPRLIASNSQPVRDYPDGDGPEAA